MRRMEGVWLEHGVEWHLLVEVKKIAWYFKCVCTYAITFSLNIDITCLELSMISNGFRISYDISETSIGSGMYPFDTVATYDGCVTGYALVGDFTSRCTGDGVSVNGVFDATPPICQGLCLHMF